MIAPLGPDHIPQLVHVLCSIWPDWYGPGGNGDARADLAARCGPGLPRGWVALRDGIPVGTVALCATSYGARPGESPWLSGLCTVSRMRGQGIGAALIAEVERATEGSLFTTTREAAPLFARRGWHVLRNVEDGWQVWRR